LNFFVIPRTPVYRGGDEAGREGERRGLEGFYHSHSPSFIKEGEWNERRWERAPGERIGKGGEGKGPEEDLAGGFGDRRPRVPVF